MHNNGILLKTISPPAINSVLSCISIAGGICYLMAIPLIDKKNYSIFAILIFAMQTVSGMIGLLYSRNRRMKIYDKYIEYVSPFGKHIFFIPFEAELIVIRPIARRYMGGIVIHVKRFKLRVPQNYTNYSYLEKYMFQSANCIVYKRGIM